MATKFRFAFPPAMAASSIIALLLPAVSPAREEDNRRLDTLFTIGEERKLPKYATPGSDLDGWWWLPVTNVNSLEDIR